MNKLVAEIIFLEFKFYGNFSFDLVFTLSEPYAAHMK